MCLALLKPKCNNAQGLYSACYYSKREQTHCVFVIKIAILIHVTLICP